MKWFSGVVALAAAVAFLASGSAATEPQAIQPDQALLRMLPEDTRGVLFADISELRDVALIRGFVEDQAGLQIPAPIEDFRAATGVDVINDLEQVMSGRSGPDQFLSVVRASFDAGRVEAFLETLGGASEPYGAWMIYRPNPDDDDFAVAFPSDGLVILGPAAAVRSALDRAGGGPSALDNPELMAEIAAIDAGSQVWGVGRFADLVPAGLAPPMAADLIEALEDIRYQMRLDEGIFARLQGTFATPDTARRTGDLLRGFVALGKMGSAQQPDMVEFLDGLQVENEENSVEVRFAATQELLDRVASSIDLSSLPDIPRIE